MDDPDEFEVLCNAICNLQDALWAFGSEVELAEIKLKPSRRGGFHLEMRARRSPSFLKMWTPDFDRDKPPGVVMELMGVKITHTRT